MFARVSAVAVALILTLFGVSAAAEESTSEECTSDALSSEAPAEDEDAEMRDGPRFLGCVRFHWECRQRALRHGYHHHFVNPGHWCHHWGGHLACYGVHHHHIP
jgi:hypothetical protein